MGRGGSVRGREGVGREMEREGSTWIFVQGPPEFLVMPLDPVCMPHDH